MLKHNLHSQPHVRIMSTRLIAVFALIFSATIFSSTATAADWIPLFDGKSLDGWERKGGTAEYEVEDGMIVGTTVARSPNTFLCKGPFSDFVLEFDVLCDKALNSGVQIRSHTYEKDTPLESKKGKVRPAGDVYGYQCESAAAESGACGNFWDEARRTNGSTIFPTSPKRPTPSKMTNGITTASSRKVITSAPGSTASPAPTFTTTSTPVASSASKFTAFPRPPARTKSAGKTSASANSKRARKLISASTRRMREARPLLRWIAKIHSKTTILPSKNRVAVATATKTKSMRRLNSDIST